MGLKLDKLIFVPLLIQIISPPIKGAANFFFEAFMILYNESESVYVSHYSCVVGEHSLGSQLLANVLTFVQIPPLDQKLGDIPGTFVSQAFPFVTYLCVLIW